MAVLDKFVTKKTYNRSVEPKSYIDPNIQYLNENVPEGMTFPALSAVPKEYLRDPNEPLPEDKNPIDWSMGTETGGNDPSTDERNQRRLVRDYLAQKYAQAADTKGVDEALAKQKYENEWADAGHNVDRMLMAHSAARGGPGADAAYWQGQKKEAAGAVDQQEALRQAKIKDYLMKQKLGSEGVDELQQMHGYDITNAQNDPTSNISRSYQNAFGSMFPQEAKDMGGDIPNMSATEIAGIAKMYGAKAEAELRRNVEMAKLGYADAGLQMQGRKIDAEEARAGRETTELAPKTKAEIDRINADIALTQARTKAVQAGKPGAAPGVPGAAGSAETNPIPLRPMTESQSKALSYWERADRANAAMDGLVDLKGYKVPSSASKQIAIDTYLQSSGVSRALAKKLLTPDDLEFANANMGFMNAILRQDSGANIPENEYSKYKPMLPEYGDTDEILAQKKAERESIVQSLGMSAGDANTQELKKRRILAPAKEALKIPENSFPYSPEIYKALEFIKNPKNKNHEYYGRTVEKLKKQGVIK